MIYMLQFLTAPPAGVKFSAYTNNIQISSSWEIPKSFCCWHGVIFNNLPNRRGQKSPTVPWLAGHITDKSATKTVANLKALWAALVEKKFTKIIMLGLLRMMSFIPKRGVVSENPLDPQSKPSHPFSDFRLPLDVFAVALHLLNSAGLRLIQVKHFFNSHTGTQKKNEALQMVVGNSDRSHEGWC